jgi:hypothetical protein
MYMLIPEISSEHASHPYVLESAAHLGSLLWLRLISCLPLNAIDKFLVKRFVDVKRVQYKDVTLLQTYYF